MRIRHWSSDVCSSDLHRPLRLGRHLAEDMNALGLKPLKMGQGHGRVSKLFTPPFLTHATHPRHNDFLYGQKPGTRPKRHPLRHAGERRNPARIRRSEEHTSELQSLMRTSYAVFCLKKKKNTRKNIT